MNEPLLGYGKQGLALEVNPWQSKRSIEAVLLYRGAIVSAWANVEASIIEVALRSSIHPRYSHIRDTYPSRLDGRVKYLRKVLASDGPLANHASLGNAILNRYVESADLRNLMAHAGMRVMPQWGTTFQMFKPKADQEVALLRIRYTEEALNNLAHKAARFSRAVKSLLARLDNANLLPQLSELE